MRILCVLLTLASLGILSLVFGTRASAEDPVGRRFQEIHNDIKAFTRRTKNAESDRARANAVVDLCLLHYEITSDPRFSTSPTLRGYRGRIWNRLTTIRKELERKLKRDPTAGPSSLFSDDTQSLAPEKLDDQWLSQSLADQWMILGQTTGGPVNIVERSGGYLGGVLGDFGWDLVRLIEETLKPDFWESSGGPGNIVYYGPLRILVVRATTQVHEDLTDFLERLR